MERLNYDVLKKSGYDGYVLKDAPEKVLQFGEGNFLRAFVDYWFDLANEKAGWNGKCCLSDSGGGRWSVGPVSSRYSDPPVFQGRYHIHNPTGWHSGTNGQNLPAGQNPGLF